MVELKDIYNRSFKTLRVSLLDTCNLSCIYCTCGDDDIKQNYQASKSRSLQPADLVSLIRKLHTLLGLETIRLTGGEPLIYPHLIKVIEGVRDLGVDLKLTTNGVLLEKMSRALKAAGITSINVSLDAIDEEVFNTISRRNDVSRIIRGIDAAIGVGIEVKLNAVIMRGVNEDQVLPLADYAFQRNIRLRFLEIMSMGHLHGTDDSRFYSQQALLDQLAARYEFQPLTRSKSSTANYWKTAEGHVFGIVANESQPFCNDCNRLRLDSFGNIYGCLSDNSPIRILETDTTEGLTEKLQKAMNQKQLEKFQGSALTMLQIGG